MMTIAPPWLQLDERADDRTVALRRGGWRNRDVSWRLLSLRARQLAGVLHHAGVRRGARVAVITEAGSMRSAAVYAVWRLGGIVVAASETLPTRERLRAIAGASPTVVIADRRGLRATRRLESVGLRLATEPLSMLDGLVTGTQLDLGALVARRPHVPLPTAPRPHDDAALLFGRPDPGAAPIGVFYTHAELTGIYSAARALQEPAPAGALSVCAATMARRARAGSAGLAAALVLPGFPAAELHLPTGMIDDIRPAPRAVPGRAVAGDPRLRARV